VYLSDCFYARAEGLCHLSDEPLEASDDADTEDVGRCKKTSQTASCSLASSQVDPLQFECLQVTWNDSRRVIKLLPGRSRKASMASFMMPRFVEKVEVTDISG
jgi:hypothetical protein